MMLLDGRQVAHMWQDSLHDRIHRLADQGVTPGLAVLLVGDDPASHLYVTRKESAAQALGFRFTKRVLPQGTTTQAAQAVVSELNSDPLSHGLIVQLPLPEPIDEDTILETLDPQKDIDGLHPANLGELLIGHEKIVPATPKGIIRLLETYHLPTEGKHVVIVGRSAILGKPLAAMFLNRNATVTICHSKTDDLGFFTRQADLIVMDTGVPGLLRAEMVAEKAVIIDAGISKLPDGRVVGDVDFTAVAPKVAAITPVPGGVGPMTIAALLDTTLELAEKSQKD